MTAITQELLDEIVNEQHIVALGLVTPAGKPHSTPIWIAHDKGYLYMFSRSSRAKTKYAKQTGECMIAFNWASIYGKIEVFHRGSSGYDQVKDVFDSRYGKEGGYEDYKKHWDVVFKITPEKLFR